MIAAISSVSDVYCSSSGGHGLELTFLAGSGFSETILAGPVVSASVENENYFRNEISIGLPGRS